VNARNRIRQAAAVTAAIVAGGLAVGGRASADSVRTVSPAHAEVETSTALKASPSSPAAHGSRVTLTATVTQVPGKTNPRADIASCGTVPKGTVDFKDGATSLGSVPVGSSGLAKETVTPRDGAHSFTASYEPARGSAFEGSKSRRLSYTVTPRSGGGGQLGSGTETVTVTIAPGGAQGQFTMTVPSTGDTLTVSADGTSASGPLAAVQVSDTRQSSAGWTVAGQASAFTMAGGGSFSGNALGWTPSLGASTGPVTVGPAVAPDSPGLGSAPGELGSATGDSTASLGGTLNLAIPSGQAAGNYTSTITITAI
jgi:Bacterial Ig-like domain (group 3)